MKPPEDLFKRTKQFALRVIRLYSLLPKTEPARVLGRQLLRSGTSVGANYREAKRARSTLEFVAKLGDSLKEAEESQYWLELLAEGEILSSDKLKPLTEEAGELAAILFTIIRKARKDS
jgi:four helix bundle protein